MTDFSLDAQTWPMTGVGGASVPTRGREPALRRWVASIGFVLDSTRRRRGGRMVLWTVVISLLAMALYMLSYPMLTDLWAHRIQGGLRGEFAQMQQSGGKGFVRNKLVNGQALTRLKIPKLHVDLIVVEGWSGNALRAGVGHKPGSALPGDPVGNVVIAGHRTGFGSPFLNLPRLTQGDRIQAITPLGTFNYEVTGPLDGHTNPWDTSPDDLSVTLWTPVPSMTLITCDPPHSGGKYRLIVRARLLGPA